MKPEKCEIKIKFNFELTLWQAIKLRIAGKAVKGLVDQVRKQMEANSDVLQCN